MLFYFICEIFDEPAAKNKLKLSDFKTTVTKQGSGDENYYDNWNNSVYGSEWMESDKQQIYKFAIKVNKAAAQGICIGVVFSGHPLSGQGNPFFREKESYCIFNSGEWSKVEGGAKKIDGPRWGVGDTFVMILDCKEKQICGYKNDDVQDIRVLIREIKVGDAFRYKLALSLYDSSISVTVSKIY